MRLIDADALMEEVNIEIREYMLTEKGMRSLIRNAPTIDAVEVVRGEWIDKPTKGVRYICSRCTGRFDYQWKYCPNCGARMKGADDE